MSDQTNSKVFQLPAREKRRIIRQRYARAVRDDDYADEPVEDLVELRTARNSKGVAVSRQALILNVDQEPPCNHNAVDIILHDCSNVCTNDGDDPCECGPQILPPEEDFGPCVDQELTPPEALYYLGVPWLCRVCPQMSFEGGCGGLRPRTPQGSMELFPRRCPERAYPVPPLPPVCEGCPSLEGGCDTLDRVQEKYSSSAGCCDPFMTDELVDDVGDGPFVANELVGACGKLSAKYGVKCLTPAKVLSLYADKRGCNPELDQEIVDWMLDYYQVCDFWVPGGCDGGGPDASEDEFCANCALKDTDISEDEEELINTNPPKARN